MTGSAEQPLLASVEREVLTLQLNRPRARNAINRVLRVQLRDALQAAAVDDAIRVVVLRGDERSFCAGGDIKEMGNGPADNAMKLGLAKQIVQAIADMPKPVVAVVRGHAAGAGFSTALACDFVVADESARFHASFVDRGLVPDMGASYWLVRQVGLHRAKAILLTGRVLTGQDGLELGFVSHVWPKGDLESRLHELTSALAAASPTALGLTKRMLNRAFETDLSASLDTELVSQLLAADSSEARGTLPPTANAAH
jgi:2-(1,2-epoxy-1,2-dihydrophenyl)acetyl-CoA isomerase